MLPPLEFEWLDLACEGSSIKPRTEYAIISDSGAFSGNFCLSYLSINMIIQLKEIIHSVLVSSLKITEIPTR